MVNLPTSPPIIIPPVRDLAQTCPEICYWGCQFPARIKLEGMGPPVVCLVQIQQNAGHLNAKVNWKCWMTVAMGVLENLPSNCFRWVDPGHSVLWQSQQLTAVQRTSLGCVPPSPMCRNLKAQFKCTFSLWRFLPSYYTAVGDTHLQPQLTLTKKDLTHPHTDRCLLCIAVSSWNKREINITQKKKALKNWNSL